MDNKDTKKKEPWRIVVFIISVVYIVFMWVKKDIAVIYATMPADHVVPLIATTVMVSLVKVVAIAGGILLVKWVITKLK